MANPKVSTRVAELRERGDYGEGGRNERRDLAAASLMSRE